MNQINPLHIGGLLLVLLAYTLFHLSGLKKELIEVKSAYKESQKVAVDLSSLKNIYANKTKIKSSLNRILSQATLKSANFLVKKSKTSMNISSKSMDARALNSFLSKLLNSSYNITRLKIKRLSSTKSSINLEIKW